MKKSRLLSILAYIKRVLKQLKDLKNWKGLFLIFYGFTPNKINLYRGIKENREYYVNDWFRYTKFWEITDSFRVLFNDKLANYYLLKNYTNNVCPIVAYYGYYDELNIIDEKYLGQDQYLIKPRNGWGGGGVTVTDDFYELDNLKNVIISPLLSNNNYASKIFPKTLNTMRIVTALVNDKIEIIAAVHRFGSSNSSQKYVDNFTQGGISASININSGVISKALRVYNSELEDLTKHPDTNEPIVGVKIINWDSMTSELIAIHEKLKFVKCLGWDIAMIKDDFMIIEVNHLTDLDLVQCHDPILMNENANKFFKNYL